MDVISAEAYQLGEGPRVDPRTGELVWVDIAAGRLHRGRWQNATLTPIAGYQVGTHVGAVAPPGGCDVVGGGREREVGVGAVVL